MYKEKARQIWKARKICFETKKEANAAIQDLNETTRYIAKEHEHKKQRINIDNQNKINTNIAKEKEQKSNLLNTVTMNTKLKQHNRQIDQNKIKSKELII